MRAPNLNPPEKDLRIFAILLLLPVLLLYYKFSLPVVAYVIGVISVVGELFPTVIKPLHNFLVLITWPIGFFLGHLLLTGIYYLILTSIALCKKRPLDLRFPPKEKSNFTLLPEKEARSYYDPFYSYC